METSESQEKEVDRNKKVRLDTDKNSGILERILEKGNKDDSPDNDNGQNADNKSLKKVYELLGFIIALAVPFLTFYSSFIDHYDDFSRMRFIYLGLTGWFGFYIFLWIKANKIIRLRQYSLWILSVFCIVMLVFTVISFKSVGLEAEESEPEINIEQTEEPQEPSMEITTSEADDVEKPDDLGAETPTPEPEPTEDLSPTEEVVEDTDTPEPETMPDDQNVGNYEYISIGLVNLDIYAECSMNQDIQPYLEELGFEVELIRLVSTISQMDAYDVVYIPYGWSCAEDDFRKRATFFQEYTNDGGGLLIGNPNIDPAIELFKITIFQTDLIYSHIEDADNSGMIVNENKTHFLLKNYPESYLPIPEIGLTLNNLDFLDVLVVGNLSKSHSLVVYNEQEFEYFKNSGRAIILSGGDLPGSEHQLLDKVMRRFIRWLAKDIN